MDKKIFPVQNSILSADALAKEVLTQYKFKKINSCVFYRKSMSDVRKIDVNYFNWHMDWFKSWQKERKIMLSG